MNILALDTATEACSVAVLRDGTEVFAEFELAPRQHNRLLPLMLDKVLVSAGISRQAISHCAYTSGPGAFTGVRIATAQAQGIGLALDIPLIPVSTLAVLAQQCFDEMPVQKVISCIDARMGEIYWGQYQRDSNGLARLLGDEQLTATHAEISTADAGAIVGSGVSVIPQHGVDHRDIQLIADYLPKAAAMLPLALRAASEGHYVPASAAPINYLRNHVAEKPKLA